jgi:hypothetical protein
MLRKKGVNGIEVDTTGGKTTLTPVKETEEIDEKFESKKQQKYFYSKCGDGNTKEQVKVVR